MVEDHRRILNLFLRGSRMAKTFLERLLRPLRHLSSLSPFLPLFLLVRPASASITNLADPQTFSLEYWPFPIAMVVIAVAATGAAEYTGDRLMFHGGLMNLSAFGYLMELAEEAQPALVMWPCVHLVLYWNS